MSATVRRPDPGEHVRIGLVPALRTSPRKRRPLPELRPLVDHGDCSDRGAVGFRIWSVDIPVGPPSCSTRRGNSIGVHTFPDRAGPKFVVGILGVRPFARHRNSDRAGSVVHSCLRRIGFPKSPGTESTPRPARSGKSGPSGTGGITGCGLASRSNCASAHPRHECCVHVPSDNRRSRFRTLI